MRALHTTLALETGTAWTPAMFVKARRPARAPAKATTTWATMRSAALFLLAPFVGLLYAVLLPFVGLGMLAWFAVRTFVETGRLATLLRAGRQLLLVAIAPFAALAYVVALPFIGGAMLAWFGVTAMMPAAVR